MREIEQGECAIRVYGDYGPEDVIVGYYCTVDVEPVTEDCGQCKTPKTLKVGSFDTLTEALIAAVDALEAHWRETERSFWGIPIYPGDGSGDMTSAEEKKMKASWSDLVKMAAQKKARRAKAEKKSEEKEAQRIEDEKASHRRGKIIAADFKGTDDEAKLKKFMARMKRIDFFDNDGKPGRGWVLFDDRDEALISAGSEYQFKDMGALRVQEALWKLDGIQETEYICRASSDAVDILWDLPKEAWRDASRVIDCIYAGKRLDPKHLKYALKRWRIWEKGYGLYREVEGKFYVYQCFDEDDLREDDD